MRLQIDKVHNKDKVFKESLSLYKGRTFNFLRLDLPEITEMLSSEITEVKTVKAFADKVFKLANGKGLHMEWEADLSKDDMLRFFSYNVYLERKHGIQFTTVILTNNKPCVINHISISTAFTPIVINLGERNGDAAYIQMKERLKAGEMIDELELIYLPLYNSSKSMYDLLDAAIKLAPEIKKDTAELDKLLSLILLQVGRFADEKEFKKVLEANAVILENNVAVKVIEEMGMKKGIEKGMEKGKAETAFEMFADNFSLSQIAKYTKMPIEWVEKTVNEAKLRT